MKDFNLQYLLSYITGHLKKLSAIESMKRLLYPLAGTLSLGLMLLGSCTKDAPSPARPRCKVIQVVESGNGAYITTKNEYDGSDRLIRKTALEFFSDAEAVTTYQYNQKGQLIRQDYKGYMINGRPVSGVNDLVYGTHEYNQCAAPEIGLQVKV